MVSRPWNQPIETFFFQEEVSWRFAYLCLKMSVMQKRLSVQFYCDIYVRHRSAFGSIASGRRFDARVHE